jgi:hypothetical protein
VQENVIHHMKLHCGFSPIEESSTDKKRVKGSQAVHESSRILKQLFDGREDALKASSRPSSFKIKNWQRRCQFFILNDDGKWQQARAYRRFSRNTAVCEPATGPIA